MRISHCLSSGLLTATSLLLALPVGTAAASEPDNDDGKYALRYRFRPGETLRWEVVHQTKSDTTISDTTKRAETFTRSVKAWKVTDVQADGTAKFVCSVERIEMRQKMSGNDEVRYDSRTDEQPPPGFATVAESIGVPLTIISMDPTGEVLRREQKQVNPAVRPGDGQLTIPLPKEPVPIGHSWSLPFESQVNLKNGMIKRIKTLQSYTLENVQTGVATIRMATRILTPVDDPAIRSQLMHRESTGTVRFDVDAGRILSQQVDVDRQVVGFRTAASSTHYVTRFTERLLPDAETATRAAAILR
jgi:hypothetical protein